MDIFKEFDSILAALTRDQWGPYLDFYKNRTQKNAIAPNKKIFTENDAEKIYEYYEELFNMYDAPVTEYFTKSAYFLTSWFKKHKEAEWMRKYKERQIRDIEDSAEKYLKDIGFIDYIKKVAKIPGVNKKTISEVEHTFPFIMSFTRIGRNTLQVIKETIYSFIGEETEEYEVDRDVFYDGNLYSRHPSSKAVTLVKANPKIQELYEELFRSNSAKWRIELPISLNTDNDYVDFVISNIKSTEEIKPYDAVYDVLEAAKTVFMHIGNTKELHGIDEAISSLDDNENIRKYIKQFFVEGLYYSFSIANRKYAIGKILEAAVSILKKENYLGSEKYCVEEIQYYYSRIKAPNNRDMKVILSRHPYDIAGMTEGRKWKSCTNLTLGAYKWCVASSIGAGALIAYLCYANDTTALRSGSKYHKNSKPNIQRPLGRILIKPYVVSDGKDIAEADYDDPNFVLICSAAYGTFPDNVIIQVQDWLNENWNDKIVGSEFGISQDVYKEQSDPAMISRSEGKNFSPNLLSAKRR